MIPLVLTSAGSASAADAFIQKKTFGLGMAMSIISDERWILS